MSSKTISKTRKVGGSLVVTIPKELVELEGLKKDQFVELSIKKIKKSYKGILKCKEPFKKEDKLDVH